MLREINRVLRPLKNRIASMVGRCLISAIDDSKAIQIVQLSGVGSRVFNAVERVQNFGFSSVPPVGSEAVVLCVGGSAESPIVIVCDSGEKRKKGLTAGDSCQYDAHGEYIVLSNNKIEIHSGSDVDVDATNVNVVSGNIKLGSKLLTALDGVVTKSCQCNFFGPAHPVGSAVVKAKLV